MKGLIGFTGCLFILTVAGNAESMVNVVKFVNHTAAEIKKNKAALEKISEVANSDCFKSGMISRSMIQTNGLTSAQVVEKLISTTVSPELHMYYTFASVNGYTKPGVNKIFLNRRLHKNYGVCSVASNLFHESSHKMGFSHDYKPSKQRPYSVPYSVNVVFEKCCK